MPFMKAFRIFLRRYIWVAAIVAAIALGLSIYVQTYVRSVSLVIDGIEKGIFHAECIMGWRGRPSAVRCPIGKVLALCAKASGHIFAEEIVLDEAGITAKG